MAKNMSHQSCIGERDSDDRKTCGNLLRACAPSGLPRLRARPRHGEGLAHGVLIFDSTVSPRTPGIRLATPFPRRLLFRSGDFHVDLELEPTGLREEIRITGQVLDVSQAEVQLAGIRVAARNGSEQSAKTQTNEFGEFVLVIQKSVRPWLFVQVNEHRLIKISLEGKI